MTLPSSKSICAKIAHILAYHDENQILWPNKGILYFKVANMKIK